MTKDVDQYLLEGCGRCELGGTPDCKVHRWSAELQQLRRIVNACGLTEKAKWGVPCYTLDGKNILIVSAFKDFCSINFFKGSLLSDEHKLLVTQGENSVAARLIKFTDVQQVESNEQIIKQYIFEAIEVERAGLKVKSKAVDDYDFPEELRIYLAENPEINEAYEALTPGRQKSYILHISQAKQAKTREARVEKCIPKILAGKGFNEY